MLPIHDDVDLTRHHIQALSSADQLATFFTYLRYPAETRLPMTAEALSLNADLARAVKHCERLTRVDDGVNVLEVYLFELKTVTMAHTQALARAFRNRVGNFLLVLTNDYAQLDFVLLERELPTAEDGTLRSVIIRPRVFAVDRRAPDAVAARVLRRFTFTEYDAAGQPDVLAQYDKLRSAYTIAEWSEPFFNNRALFSDYYLRERLPNLPEWNDDNRNRVFRQVREAFAQARRRFSGKPGDETRAGLIRPLLEMLGFRVTASRKGVPATSLLRLHAGEATEPCAFALAYAWNRNLDGKDEARDALHPEENPGAQVVSLLDAGEAPWAIVTNGKTWRLYSARAHSRATNYYEIDLEETLASPDPGEAFRYFYLFFRAQAFALPTTHPPEGEVPPSVHSPFTIHHSPFLDWLFEESAAYARELGERLKERIFESIFPHFAEGFIAGMGGGEVLLDLPEAARAQQLDAVFQGTLTFLYRLLFLLYAESRDLLPVREIHGYYQVSLQRLKAEIAAQAGRIEDEVPGKLAALAPVLSPTGRGESLYDRLLALFKVVDQGSAAYNVPVYNGGLFMTAPVVDDPGAEARDARFLLNTRMPDRYLALGLDRLARDVDPKRGDLAFIDYKSLGVRQLGSIYEGLLEFKVRVAAEKMAVVKGKKTEEIIPYVEAQRQKATILTEGRGRSGRERILPRGTIYLGNDRRERKATGSYYTPDYIVKYIVRQAVGPVLDEKLTALRPRLREAEQRYHATLKRKTEIEGVRYPNRYALLNDTAGDVLRDLFDIKILDPAMGSGHFLVEAVDYVTDRLVQFLDGFPFLSTFFAGMREGILEAMARQGVSVDPARLTDVALLKRHVLKRCIYGVDLNPMAVELAKVSLWLDCFTLGAPLSFLDHHLRCGNSLIGARAQQVEAAMSDPGAAGQITFLTGPFVGLLRAAEIMRGISSLTDVTLEQVHESGQLFRAFDRAAKPYKQLLDIYVAQHFGVARAAEFLKLYGPEALKADPAKLARPYQQVIEQTRALYEEKRFFHWDLEFPEVFIDLERAAWKEDGGFDAVVGNPPYDELSENALGRIIDERNFFQVTPAYSPAKDSGGRLNWYHFFMLLGVDIVSDNGYYGYIVPMSWIGDSFTSGVRQWLLKNHCPLTIDAFPQKDDPKRRVFPEAKLPTSIFIAKKNRSADEIRVRVHPGRDILDIPFYVAEFEVIKKLSPEIPIIPTVSQTGWEILRSVATSKKLGPLKEHAAEPTSGEIIFNAATRQYFTEDESYDLILRGGHIQRYELLDKARQGEPLYLKTKEYLANSQSDSKAFDHQKPRVVYQEGSAIDAWRRLIPTHLPAGYICGHKICYFVNYKIEPLTLLAVLASRLMNWLVESLSTTNSLPAYLIGSLPFPTFTFTTPPAKRAHLLAEAQRLYEQMANGEWRMVNGESRITHHALRDFVEARLEAEPEQADVIHDLLAYLAQQMMDLNKQKQAEQQRFFGWLEAQARIRPDKQGRAGIDALSGKTTVWGYLGDYQKDEPEAAWDKIEDVLHKNRRQLGVDLSPALLGALRREYEASLAVLRPFKARLASTDRLIDEIVYRLYGLTAEEIGVVEGKPREESEMPARTIGREHDPRVLAGVLTALQRQGASALRHVQEAFSARGDRLGPDKAATIRREFEFLGWLQPETGDWVLTESGQVAARQASGDVAKFARYLAVTHDQHTQREISQLLNRMWVLNPQGQGAIIIPQPTFDALPAKLDDVRPWLTQEMERWNRALKQQMPDSPAPNAPEAVDYMITQSLTRWEERSESEKRSNVLKAVGDRYWEAMFGYLMAAGDVRIWQNRLDWAALTHTAYRLPGIPAQVWFPVGAFRQAPDENFTPVDSLVYDGQTFYRYTPAGSAFYEQFGQVLYEGYRQQQRAEQVEYVSLLAVRDWVCYRLRISHAIFESTLQAIFPLALRGDMPFNLALEVDVTPTEQRMIEQSRERPVVIDATPRYIVAMRLRK